MHDALLDTSTCFEIVLGADSDLLLSKIEQFVATNKLRLIVPEVVANEFARHREDQEQRTLKKQLSILENAKKLLREHCDSSQHQAISSSFEVTEKAIGDQKAGIDRAINRVEDLFRHPSTQRPGLNLGINERVVDRGIKKLAPFNRTKKAPSETRNKNSVADAVVFETFVESVKLRETNARKMIFVNANPNDFSDANDSSLPHPDLAEVFQKPNVEYCPNIGAVLNQIEETAVPEPVVRHISDVIEMRHGRCPKCGNGKMVDGTYHPSQYGGLTWHLICDNCRNLIDTGDSFD